MVGAAWHSPAGCLFSPGSSPGPSLMPPVWTGSGGSSGRTVGHTGAAGALCASLAGRTPGTSQRLLLGLRPDHFLVHDCWLHRRSPGAGVSSAWALAHDGAQPSCPAPRGLDPRDKQSVLGHRATWGLMACAVLGGLMGWVTGSLFQTLGRGSWSCNSCIRMPALPSAQEPVCPADRPSFPLRGVNT